MAIFSRIRCWCLALLLPSSALAIGGYATVDVVDPSIYVSADGHWQWRVDPLQRNGGGGARYQLSRDGELRLSLQLPYTLLGAKVSADGLLVGHALHGEIEPGYGYRELLVARVATTGEANVWLREPREAGVGLHFPDLPHPQRSLLDETGQRFLLNVLVRDSDWQQGVWWSFDLSERALQRPLVVSAPPTDSASDAEIAPTPMRGRRLPVVGELLLRQPVEQAAPLSTHYDFNIDDGGQFGVLRWRAEGDCEFVLIDEGDAILQRWPLSDQPSGCPSTLQAHWISQSRWLLIDSEHPYSRAWWLEADRGAISAGPSFESQSVEELAPDGRGGFVAVLQRIDGVDLQASLTAFDAAGEQRWSQCLDSSNYGLAFASDADLIAVLERSSIDLYRSDGQFLRRIDLDEALGRELGYAASLHAGRDGSLMLEDSSGAHGYVQLDVDGRVIAELDVADADDAPFETVGGLQQAPDGAWWTSNGRELRRLDSAGRVERVVGAAGRDALSTIATLRVSLQGDIVAVDRYSGAVHQFDAQGRWLQACHPQSGDYPEQVANSELSLSSAGEMLVGRREEPPDALLYDAGCQRVGVLGPATDDYTEHWYFADQAERYWVVGDTVIRLLDRGVPTLSMERTPAGHWLHRPFPAVSTPDGSLLAHVAWVPAQEGAVEPPHPAAFLMWSPQGQLLRETPAPVDLRAWSGLSTDGRRVAYLLDSGEVVVQDLTSAKAFQVEDLSIDRSEVFLVRAGTGMELWIWDGEWRIERRALE